MVGQIKTVNGVKKIVPLTAEARAGNPVSTIIAIYSNLVPYGYLPCNGVQFDETQFPALYAILGDNHTPDLRECALVGAGQNTTDTIATHDVYEVGEFKDDQLQNHGHFFRQSTSVGGSGNVGTYGGAFVAQNSGAITTVASARYGDTTRGKSKGVNYCIKATAGLDESDADYVLGVLAPVDEVAVDNMHSVTSNAVAEKILNLGNDFTFTQVSGLTYANFQSFKFGNMCVLTGAINGSNISDGASLLTLPSGCRPSKSIYINGVCESSGAKYPCVFEINSSSGGTKVYHQGSSITGVFMSIIFKC